MVRHFIEDDHGAVTADWITLSAGIILLGIMVVFSVMTNSAGYLMDEFDDLNGKFQQDSEALAMGDGATYEEDAKAAAASNARLALEAASTSAIDSRSSSASPASPAQPGSKVPVSKF